MIGVVARPSGGMGKKDTNDVASEIGWTKRTKAIGKGPAQKGSRISSSWH
jgi:hypothetical protein